MRTGYRRVRLDAKSLPLRVQHDVTIVGTALVVCLQSRRLERGAFLMQKNLDRFVDIWYHNVNKT